MPHLWPVILLGGSGGLSTSVNEGFRVWDSGDSGFNGDSWVYGLSGLLAYLLHPPAP